MKRFLTIFLFAVCGLNVGCGPFGPHPSQKIMSFVNLQYPDFYLSTKDCNSRYKPISLFSYEFIPEFKYWTKEELTKIYGSKRSFGEWAYTHLDAQDCLRETIEKVKEIFFANGIIWLEIKIDAISQESGPKIVSGRKIIINGLAIQMEK
jgi:hypothetical protein